MKKTTTKNFDLRLFDFFNFPNGPNDKLHHRRLGEDLKFQPWICDSSMFGKSSKKIFSQMVVNDGDESPWYDPNP